MAAPKIDQTTPAIEDAGSRISSVPLLGEGFSESGSKPSSSDQNITSTENEVSNNSELDAKTGKRRFWGLGKKKDDGKLKSKRDAVSPNTASTAAAPVTNMRPISPLHSPHFSNMASSPYPVSHPYGSPSSPNRKMSSGSPHIPSPASSQIFERNVQEDALLASASPAIPAHITTENHIPPVLDASSVAITDDHLNPDNVEIVTHPVHQPAAVTVAGGGAGDVAAPAWQEDSLGHAETDDSTSNYGALDTNDVRRLSFISFADVVHAEHAADHAGGRDLAAMSGAPSMAPLASVANLNRSPSPVRSPISSQGLSGSPPLSESVSSKGVDSSPNRGGRGLGSTLTGHSPPVGSELTVETMRQALRKTGSGDLSGARSQPISAIGSDEGLAEQPFK
ncbi:MAG: hypothetical protein LQ342_002138 [Letrouitia transgressa]|nr:MAG: hypothetical protein LQ342_002138 [Letrouitia transgressa]